MEMPKMEKQIQFRIKNIQITECSFRKPKQEIQKDQNFGFSFSFGVNFDKVNSEIMIEVAVNIYLSPKQKVVIGEIKAVNHFDINNFSDFVINKDQFAFPEDFIVMIMSISFSTLRGIVLEKTASSLQRSIVLPVININEIVKNKKPEDKHRIKNH